MLDLLAARHLVTVLPKTVSQAGRLWPHSALLHMLDCRQLINAGNLLFRRWVL